MIPGHDQMDAGHGEVGGVCPGRGRNGGEAPGRGRLLEWVESQSRVTRIWLDELIAEGDPNDMATLIHKQAAWLDLMQARLKEN